MREKQLLNILLEYKSYVTGTFLASQLNVSVKTLQKTIASLNQELKAYGALVESKRNNGYIVRIIDEKKFQQLREIWTKPNELEITSILRILLEKEYVKSEDLQEQLYINSAKLTKYLKEVREYLKKFQLELISRPYYGLHVEGSEFYKRLCICDILTRESREFQNENSSIIDKISDIVMSRITQYDYTMSDDLCFNLILHLAIALLRVKGKKSVSITPIQEEELKKKKEYIIAKNIIEAMENEFNVKFDNSEISYVTIHLISKETIHGNNLMDIPKEIDSLVCEMLQYIDKKFNLNMSKNLELRVNIGLHMVPLVNRLTYGTVIKNPILNKVKTTLIKGYEIAVASKGIIERKYNKKLNEHEISYLAIHFQLALNKHGNENKHNILLVCSSGRGTAQLMKYNFEHQFEKYIGTLDTCSSEELKNINLKKYDYIFTTLELAIKSDIPVVHVQYLMNNEDIIKIKQLLESNYTEYFSEDLFIPNLVAESREEVLKKMFDHLKRIKGVPDDFYKELLIREQHADTTFGKNSAFPHPNQVVFNQTFACIAILDKPVMWGTKEVQLIIMASIRKNGVIQDEVFFNIVSEILSNEILIQQLVAFPKYETLNEIINKINRKDNN